jgi:hypothetical protein
MYHDQTFVNACADGNLETVKKLIDKGIVEKDTKQYGFRWALFENRLHIVKYLIESGDINIYDKDNKTIKHAIIYNYFEIVMYLRTVAGDKWKCHKCLVRSTCMTLCKEFNK